MKDTVALRQRQSNAYSFEVATEVEPMSDNQPQNSSNNRTEFPSNMLIYAIILPLSIIFMILVVYLRSSSAPTETVVKTLLYLSNKQPSYQYISTAKQKSIRDIYLIGGAVSINDETQLTSQIEKYDVAFDKGNQMKRYH
jgi:hypothetical protein